MFPKKSVMHQNRIGRLIDLLDVLFGENTLFQEGFAADFQWIPLAEGIDLLLQEHREGKTDHGQRLWLQEHTAGHGSAAVDRP